MDSKHLSYNDASIMHPANPEITAHNIALTYIQSAFNFDALAGKYVDTDVIYSMTDDYMEAYSYAYNYIVHKNKLINDAE